MGFNSGFKGLNAKTSTDRRGLWSAELLYRNSHFIHDKSNHRRNKTLTEGTRRVRSYDMIWRDMIRYIYIYMMTWYDIWYDDIRYDIWYDMMTWYDMIYDYMIWYDIWYDMLWYDIHDITWYDMTWYDIWYDKIYDIIYLTAIGLTPSGSSTVHIYTQNNTQNNKIDTNNT